MGDILYEIIAKIVFIEQNAPRSIYMDIRDATLYIALFVVNSIEILRWSQHFSSPWTIHCKQPYCN